MHRNEDTYKHDAERVQKEYYNRIAKEYDQHYAHPQSLAYRYAQYDRIFEGIRLSGQVTLDAMCGGGEATGYLLKHGALVSGLDISDECCRIYRVRFPQCDIRCCSIFESGFDDGQFDLVVTDSLHHLHPGLSDGIREIHRILKPDGLLACWEPCSGSLLDLVRRAWYRLDPKFFQTNEQSIDMRSLLAAHQREFEEIRTIYGGNIAYVLVNLSMALRLPRGIVKWLAPSAICIENTLGHFKLRFFSAWVLSLLRKCTP